MTAERTLGDDGVARKYPVVTFYIFAFAISWLGFVPLLAGQYGVRFLQSEWWMLGLVLPAVGPGVAAWIAGAMAGDGVGWRGLRASISRRVAWRWWVLAVSIPLLLLLSADLLSRWLAIGQVKGSHASMGILWVAAMSVAANPWEEVGWRGFALTRLQRRYGAAVAATIVGVLWALWHVPLFLWSGSPMSAMPFWTWAAGVMGRSFVMAWMFNSASRGLAVVIVFHVSMNVFGEMIGVRSEAVFAAVNIAAAIVVFWLSGGGLGYRKELESSDSSIAGFFAKNGGRV
jgi:membrane protease YdiL (CAAX protease family)